MTEHQPKLNLTELILGTEPEVAIELEDITDELWQLTRDAEILTEHHPDRNISWLRQIPRLLPDGSKVYLSFTVDRLDDNYACIIQEIPSSDGGKKIIERRWSNTNPADTSAQIVKSSRTRPGGKKIEGGHLGFNTKDISRLQKLISMFKAEEENSAEA